jgi:hypothetical protein
MPIPKGFINYYKSRIEIERDLFYKSSRDAELRTVRLEKQLVGLTGRLTTVMREKDELRLF